MKKPFFWEKAKKVLKSKDKKLGKIISNYPKDFLFSKSDPFYTLARSIVGQQISVQAAQAVWERYEKKIKRIKLLNIITTSLKRGEMDLKLNVIFSSLRSL